MPKGIPKAGRRETDPRKTLRPKKTPRGQNKRVKEISDIVTKLFGRAGKYAPAVEVREGETPEDAADRYMAIPEDERVAYPIEITRPLWYTTWMVVLHHVDKLDIRIPYYAKRLVEFAQRQVNNLTQNSSWRSAIYSAKDRAEVRTAAYPHRPQQVTVTEHELEALWYAYPFCVYCGCFVQNPTNLARAKGATAEVDVIDARDDYALGKVALACRHCNRHKSDALPYVLMVIAYQWKDIRERGEIAYNFHQLPEGWNPAKPRGIIDIVGTPEEVNMAQSIGKKIGKHPELYADASASMRRLYSLIPPDWACHYLPFITMGIPGNQSNLHPYNFEWDRLENEGYDGILVPACRYANTVKGETTFEEFWALAHNVARVWLERGMRLEVPEIALPYAPFPRHLWHVVDKIENDPLYEHTDVKVQRSVGKAVTRRKLAAARKAERDALYEKNTSEKAED